MGGACKSVLGTVMLLILSGPPHCNIQKLAIDEGQRQDKVSKRTTAMWTYKVETSVWFDCLFSFIYLT